MDIVKRYNDDLLDKYQQDLPSWLVDKPETEEEARAKMAKLIKRANEEKEKSRIKKEKYERFKSEKFEYDEFTSKYINKFIKSFMSLYPNVLTEKELYDRINANLRSNISFGNMEELGHKRASGFFNKDGKYIVLSEKISNNDEKMDEVLFHELLHVLVEENPYDNHFHEIYEDSNFVTESIITLIEEDYVKNIMHKDVERVNGYIPTYAREIRAIVGDELITSFIRNFKEIDDVLDKCNSESDSYSALTFNLAQNIDSIYYMLRYPDSKRVDKEEVAYQNASIELDIAFMLDNYFNNNELTDEEKIEKIEKLITIQNEPNFKVFKEIIEKHIKDKSLLPDHKIADYIYRINDNNYREFYENDDSKVEKLDFRKVDKGFVNIRFKYIQYATKEIFGANDYGFSTEGFYPILKYYREKYTQYFKNKELCEYLYKFYRDGKLSIDDLDIDRMWTSSQNEDLLDVTNMISHGVEMSELLVANKLFEDEKLCRIKTKNGEEYVMSYGFIPDISRAVDIKDQIIAVNELFENTNDEADEKEMYYYMLNDFKEALSKGVTKIYACEGNDSRYAQYYYEIDGKLYSRNITVYDKNDDEYDYEHPIQVTEEVIKLKEIESIKHVKDETKEIDNEVKSTKKD